MPAQPSARVNIHVGVMARAWAFLLPTPRATANARVHDAPIPANNPYAEASRAYDLQ